jgi:Ran GTPase-activating protein (RanGAP) involved in mRNA processing and transport
VLKRNRTLKVLNLSDNKIEAPGLTALAEALVSYLRTEWNELMIEI